MGESIQAQWSLEVEAGCKDLHVKMTKFETEINMFRASFGLYG